MATYLTTNFTLEELTATNTGYPNVPKLNSSAMGCIKAMARLLQQCRDYLTKPIYVNSCYRSPLVNAKVGGARNSFHLTGCAVDISVYHYSDLDKRNLEYALNRFSPCEFIKYDTFWHVAFDFSTLGNDSRQVSTWDKDFPEMAQVRQIEDL